MDYEVVDIRSEDDVLSKAVFAFPQGTPPYPGVLFLHPGMGRWSLDELIAAATDPRFNGKRLVDEGYAVLTPDYRHLSHAAGEVLDTLAAYRVLCEHPEVDRDRTAFVGTSHGAIISMLMGAQVTPSCIVEEEGATDFARRYCVLQDELKAALDANGELPPYQKMDKELWEEQERRLGGSPAEVPEAYEKASPHSMADRINSPVLILAGGSAYNPDCIRMHEALVAVGKDSTLRVYPDAPHAFWWFRSENQPLEEADREIFGFLARHLKK